MTGLNKHWGDTDEDSTTYGHTVNPPPIEETGTPKSRTFTAGKDRDIHERIEVEVTNPATTSTTEDVTVGYYDGTATTDPAVSFSGVTNPATQSPSVGAGNTVVLTFLQERVALDAGDYHVDVSQSGTTLTVDATRVYTTAASYRHEESDSGEQVVTDHDGRVVSRTDPVSGKSTFPSGLGGIDVTPTHSLSLVADNGPKGAVYGGHNPQSVYVPEEQMTLLAYRGPSADPYGTWYDHETDSFGPLTQIGVNPLSDSDAHGPPSIALDADGYCYAIYGAHGGSFQLAKSDRPYDMTSWVDMGSLDSVAGGTYPSFTSYNGGLYAFYRAGSGHGSTYPVHEFGTIIESTDGGGTWTDRGPVIDLTDHPDSHADAYVSDCDELPTGNLHISWTIAHGGSHNEVRAHGFHATFDPSTGNLYGLDGTEFTTPVTWSTMSGSVLQAYQAQEANQCRHAALADGTVYLAQSAYNSTTDRIERVIHTWDTGTNTWSTETVPGAITDDIYNDCYPRVSEDGTLELYAVVTDIGDTIYLTSVLGENRGGDVYRFRRQSDGSWAMRIISPVASGSEGWNSVQAVYNGPDEFPMIFSEHNSDATINGMRFLGWGDLSQNSPLVARSTASAGGFGGTDGSVESDLGPGVLVDPIGSPFAWYPMDEGSGSTAADNIGTHDAALNGTYTWASGTWMGENALDGDGTSAYGDLGTLGTFGSSMANGISVAFTVQTDSGREHYFGTFNSNDDTAIDVRQAELGANGNVEIYLRDSAGDSIIAETGGGLIDDGNRHRVVVTSAGSAQSGLDIYVDGQQVSITTSGSGGFDTPSDFEFAPTFLARNLRGTIEQFVSGTMDDLLLYQDVLSPEQVKDDFDRQPWS